MKVKIKKLSENAFIPEHMSDSAAGFDFRSAIDITIFPYKTTYQIFKVPTDLSVEFPQGYEMNVRARSGLSLKHPNYIVITGGGTVDADYRGPINIFVINNTNHKWIISKGDRIAQGIIHRVEKATFEEVDELSTTDRGISGFGSTGVK